MNIALLGIGVVVAGLANWFLGALWYSAMLFGKKWLELGKVQINPNNMKSAMMHGLIIALVMSAVMAYLMNHFQITSIASSICFAFALWLGFVATITAYSVIYENKSRELYLLNNGYNLLGMVLTAIILTFFI